MKRAIQKSTTVDTIGLLEAFEEFIEEKEAQNKSPQTIHNYRQTFEAFCKFNGFDRHTGVESVNRKVFLDWVNDMAQDKKPVTVNHYLRDVRVFLNWCMDDDHHYIEKPFKMKEMTMQDTKPKAFCDEDMARLMERPNLKADFPEWSTYAIVCWIMDNGSRTETVCCAKMSDVDFKNKTITFSHTKNRKAQVVGMSDALSSILKEYIRKWRYDVEGDAWLFPNIGGEQLTVSGLRCAFKRYCLSRGVKQHNVHGLRHMLHKCWTGAYCRYFREAVLPLNPELQASLTTEGISPELRACAVCGKAFLPEGRQAYCSDACKAEGNRRKSRERMRKMREKRPGGCYDLPPPKA